MNGALVNRANFIVMVNDVIAFGSSSADTINNVFTLRVDDAMVSL